MEINPQYISMLKRLVESEELRHKFIFYICQIGDFSARVKYKEHFIPQRQMAWRKALTMEIEEEFNYLINLHKLEKDEGKILNQIKKRKKSLFKQITNYEQGIYEDIRFFEEKNMQEEIGRELEKVLEKEMDVDRMIYCILDKRDYLKRWRNLEEKK